MSGPPPEAPGAGFVLLPAVDVAGGRSVRLAGGRAGSETVYGDPLEAALAWQEAGAEWIHLVDLDAAFGRGANRELLAEVVGRLDVAVQLSGGIRDAAALDAALDTGCARVNVAVGALPPGPDAGWVGRAAARHGERVAVALDAVVPPGGGPAAATLAARGSGEAGGRLLDALDRLDRAGCRRYVVTDVGRDGMLAGPNLDLLRAACAATDRPVVASGGVASLADLRALAALRGAGRGAGVEGAIVGKALYAGAFTLADALRAVR